MLIRLGYDIQFETVGEVPIVTLLNVPGLCDYNVIRKSALDQLPGHRR